MRRIQTRRIRREESAVRYDRSMTITIFPFPVVTLFSSRLLVCTFLVNIFLRLYFHCVLLSCYEVLYGFISVHVLISVGFRGIGFTAGFITAMLYNSISSP